MLNDAQLQELIVKLKDRFNKNLDRHKNIDWADVEKHILGDNKKAYSLFLMESTGGEPDVIKYVEEAKGYLFVDCSKESPTDRRSLCYDDVALNSRKKDKPRSSAIAMASEMGITILNEENYCNLQKIGEFDVKTSSWILTEESVRSLGGALFGDKRFDRTFVYHNGAESYYSARGFRGYIFI